MQPGEQMFLLLALKLVGNYENDYTLFKLVAGLSLKMHLNLQNLTFFS